MVPSTSFKQKVRHQFLDACQAIGSARFARLVRLTIAAFSVHSAVLAL